MNGLRPPLTAPPGFAVRQSRSDSKECCRPALLFREGEFPWQTRKPIKNISSAGTTPLARLLSAVPDSVRPCRNYVELHIILLYFPAFCDTILILINFTAENSRWNINIFAKVFPAKSPQIHPTISEFAVPESFHRLIRSKRIFQNGSESLPTLLSVITLADRKFVAHLHPAGAFAPDQECTCWMCI